MKSVLFIVFNIITFGFFGVIRENFSTKTADNLCAHFLTLGIQAETLRRHPLEKAGVWDVLTRERHGHLVQVTGKNIGYACVNKETSREGTIFYHCDYMVPLRDTPSHLCRAKLSMKSKSFWSREIVDIEWKGETLADTLNSDPTLKQRLLEEFQLNKRLAIKITPWPAYQCARLKSGLVGPQFDLLSRNRFDCLDHIAGHIVKVEETNRAGN